MVRVCGGLTSAGLSEDARVLLQIHDELLLGAFSFLCTKCSLNATFID